MCRPHHPLTASEQRLYFWALLGLALLGFLATLVDSSRAEELNDDQKRGLIANRPDLQLPAKDTFYNSDVIRALHRAVQNKFVYGVYDVNRCGKTAVCTNNVVSDADRAKIEQEVQTLITARMVPADLIDSEK